MEECPWKRKADEASSRARAPGPGSTPLSTTTSIVSVISTPRIQPSHPDCPGLLVSRSSPGGSLLLPVWLISPEWLRWLKRGVCILRSIVPGRVTMEIISGIPNPTCLLGDTKRRRPRSFCSSLRICQPGGAGWPGLGHRGMFGTHAWQKIREEECDPPAQDDTRVPAALALVVPLAGRIAEATRRLRRPSHPRQHS